MNMSSIAWVALGLALVLVLAVVVFKLNSRGQRQAGGRGPIRFSKNSLDGRENTKPRSGLKSIAVWLAVAIILCWTILSFIHRNGSQQDDTPVVVTTPDPQLSPTLSGRLSAPDEIPDTPAVPATVATVESATAQSGQTPPPQPTGINPLPPMESVPLVTAETSPMTTAAQAMAPIISRMEPVGRQITPELPESTQVPTRPQPKPRPRLTPPVQAQPQFTPQPTTTTTPETSTLTSGRRYTVLLGSFGKSENAAQLKTKMEEAGLPATVTEVTINNRVWYRVMSGDFEDQTTAEAYGRELRQRQLVERPYVKPL